MDRIEVRAARYAALGDEARLRMVDALRFSDLTPGRLADLVDLPTNLAAHHLNTLEDAGLVTRTRSEGDGRRRYVTLRTDTLDVEGSAPVPSIGSIAFVCTHNSARSQFAAARWEQLTRTAAASAGTHPAARVHPRAVAAARAYEIDLRGRIPQDYTALGPSDVVVSVCDRALEHGLPPHGHHLHWSVPDPALDGSRASFDRAFAEIDRRIGQLAGAAA